MKCNILNHFFTVFQLFYFFYVFVAAFAMAMLGVQVEFSMREPRDGYEGIKFPADSGNLTMYGYLTGTHPKYWTAVVDFCILLFLYGVLIVRYIICNNIIIEYH